MTEFHAAGYDEVLRGRIHRVWFNIVGFIGHGRKILRYGFNSVGF